MVLLVQLTTQTTLVLSLSVVLVTVETSLLYDISGDDGSATLIDVKANDVVLGDGNNLGSLADFTAAMA
jgi:hypothetical protein